MKNVMKTTLILALFISGCASQVASTSVNYLSPRELNTNPSQYDGTQVVVKGYVLLGTNARALYQSKDRHKQWKRAWKDDDSDFDPSDYSKDCLTLLAADIFWEHRELLEEKTITIRGVFVKNYLDGNVVDLQACEEPSAFIVNQEDVKRVIESLTRKKRK